MVAHALLGIFVMGCLVQNIYPTESYDIRCPEQPEWNIRAEIQCQNATMYFCLYNDLTCSYMEGCTGPDWDRRGYKRVYSGNFNRAPCNDTHYQPINFLTNGNSDCIFRRSVCTEEGQILFTKGTTKTDSTCRCDYKQGYAFVTVPRNKCSCRPSEEDCSCYLKKCQGIGYNLSADYECTNDITKKTDCPLMSENPSEDPHIEMAPTGTPREYDSYAISTISTQTGRRSSYFEIIATTILQASSQTLRNIQFSNGRKCDAVSVVLFCISGMIVTTMCFMIHQRLSRCPQQCIKQVISMCFMYHQRLPRCPQQSTKQACTAVTERMDTGPLLNTIGQHAINDESAVEVYIESRRMDAGSSLDTIDQNATNDQSAVEAHIESGWMDAGPSLDTID